MQQNYQTTKLPTAASTADTGHTTPGAIWLNPSNITADDGTYATWGAFNPGQGSSITGSTFGFNLPPGAAIDGISVYVDGSQTGCFGSVAINVPGTASKAIGGLGTTYGSSTDKWGATTITRAQVAAITASVDVSDISGGDGFAQIDVMQVTVYWHIDLKVAPADVPTRVVYKMYSRTRKYLGDLPNVSTPFGFSQDMNSAGSTMQLTCGTSLDAATVSVDLLTESGVILEAEDGADLSATSTTNIIARGASDEEVLFKNGNRIVAMLYNYWYPNGKQMFSGQVNRVAFQYGQGTSAVTLLIYSDGADMANFIARGYPFIYTADVSQTAQNSYVTAYEDGGKGAGWLRYGQTFTTGGSVVNVGAIALLVQGSASLTVSLFDAPNGNLIGSVTKSVSDGSPTVEQFEFPQLLDVPSGTSRFFGISLQPGQSLNIYRNSSSAYAGGSAYSSAYSGGSGGGSWGTDSGDLYFITKYGSPTTTATYSGKDPVTDMMGGTLLDYNSRGGRIKRRNFVASGLSLSYTFNMATIVDVQKKTIELAPTGYYTYVDLGTAEMDFMPMSTTADYTVVRGKDINQLNLALSIEQVKNDLLFTGGEVSPGVNLFKEYQDSLSAALYGLRYTPKSDNRVILNATANAIGDTFIEENANEAQETTLTVLNNAMDITLLTPGKTIGFRNFGSFVDDMILQIVRREFKTNQVTLTLGRLPVTMNAEIQRINRDLLNEQTANNPTQPS